MGETSSSHRRGAKSDRKSRDGKDHHEHRHQDRSRDTDKNSHSSRHHKDGSRREDDHKHHRHRDETEEERRERKRIKREKENDKGRSPGKYGRSGRDDRNGVDVVDDDDGLGMWVEKGINADDAISNIPTADSLPLRSHVSQSTSASLPATTSTGSAPRERDSWMLEPDVSAPPHPLRVRRDIPHSATLPTSRQSRASPPLDRTTSDDPMIGGEDFFSAMGTEIKRKDASDKLPDPSKLVVDKRELNIQLKEGKALDEYETPEKKKAAAGGPGWQFRMRKLARMIEQAAEMGRAVEDVALERYGSLDEYAEAVEERRIIDERDSRRLSRRGTSDGGPSTPSTSGMRTPGEAPPGSAAGQGRKYMFTNPESGEYGSRPGSRAGFRRPGEAPDAGVSTPGGRIDQLRRTESGLKSVPPRGEKVSTPIPSVFTPQAIARSGTGYPFDQSATQAGEPQSSNNGSDPTSSKPPMSLEQLNRLQAQVLRAKLSDQPDAQELEEEYEYERLRYETNAPSGAGGMWAGSAGGVQGQMGRREQKEGGGAVVETQVLPTLDGRGQLYDVGLGEGGEEAVRPGNRRKKEQKVSLVQNADIPRDLQVLTSQFETRDKQGNLLRYNADDDSQTLGELVRQERFGAGSAEQKSLDSAMAQAIAGDGRYQDDLDYMDENAERLARRKMKSDAMKRQFAINDFARTKKALDTCPFCYQEDRNPLVAVVALGLRTYLSCTLTEELVPGHCIIAPIQHCLSSLEMEDDDWDEVRNFMKCLMRMHAKDNKGIIFYETILSFRQQRHTYIEAVPVPFDQFQDCPAYFRESILASESEWSQHKKLIDFSSRPGGFRRALVPNIPYFMVHWDYKGEKGYGHIIEGDEDNAGKGMGDEGEGGVYEGDKGAGGFPPYFAAEVIGNILGLEARKWLRPKRLDYALNPERAKKLGTWFQPYNWTVDLQTQGGA